MKKETVQISDRTCTIHKSEYPEYLLIQPIDEHDLEVLDNEVAVIQSQTNKPFTLVAFEIIDWQSELTPWTAPAVFGKIPFGEGAVATLSFIKDILIPQLEQMQLFDKEMHTSGSSYRPVCRAKVLLRSSPCQSPYHPPSHRQRLWL